MGTYVKIKTGGQEKKSKSNGLRRKRELIGGGEEELCKEIGTAKESE